MANKEYFAILKQGWEVWNHWREENPHIIPDLSFTNFSTLPCLKSLSGFNFSRARLYSVKIIRAEFVASNLCGVDLRNASLSEADFEGANLTNALLDKAALNRAAFLGANLHGASLKYADLTGANLCETDFTKANLRHVKLIHADFYGADFGHAKLQGVDLCKANLDGSNFSKADLTDANFTQAQVLATKFEEATLTGSCVQDWNINRLTSFKGAICDYVYLLNNQQERRPSSENSTFSPGEFTSLFEEMLNTIDLIFRDSVDWQAFFQSFQALRSRYSDDDISIQAIEKKKDGAFVIRLEVPPEADKPEIEDQIRQLYETKLEALEAQYRTELNAKDKEITIYRQQSADLLEIVKLQASRPINVEAKAEAVAEQNQNKTDLSIGSMAGAINTGSGSATASDFSQTVTNTETQQTLAEAAAEIQALLKQLEQTNPTTTMAEKMTLAGSAVAQIEADPSFKEKAIAALTAGGTKALEAAIDHPVAAFVVGAIEEWRGA